MGTLGDVKDLAIMAGLGVGAYLIFKFIKDPGIPVKSIVQTNVDIYSDIIERREDFGIPGSMNPPGYVGGTPFTPGWTGLPPSGTSGMFVYANKFASYFGLTPATVMGNTGGGNSE